MTAVFTTWRVTSDDFPRIAAQLEARVDAIVAKTALDLQGGAQGRAPVRTGTLKNSIQAVKVGDAHWKVIVGVDYGIYVEWGTRYMHAQPYLAPAADAARPAFYAALRTVFR